MCVLDMKGPRNETICTFLSRITWAVSTTVHINLYKYRYINIDICVPDSNGSDAIQSNSWHCINGLANVFHV